jgi:nitroreductase
MDLATVDHLLTTTRSVRKRLDLARPVEPAVIQECIDIALQAPNGGNRGRYHFLVVTDAEKRARLAEIYGKAARPYFEANHGSVDIPVMESAVYLADHMREVPVHIIPCIEGRVEDSGPFMQATIYGSIIPAAWSLMLALRARGLGSSWTTLHLMYEAEAAELLGIPEGITQAALLPTAYYTGEDFKPARRLSDRDRTYWDNWGDRR